MNLAPDKKLHLQWASAGAAGLVALILMALYAHPSLALAVAGPALGKALERYQVARGGTADSKDIPYTAAPFIVAAALWGVASWVMP
jgi:hypothetical protein